MCSGCLQYINNACVNGDIHLQGDIGLCAVNMVTELARDNRQILDRISHEHINHYITLLKKNMVCNTKW